MYRFEIVHRNCENLLLGDIYHNNSVSMRATCNRYFVHVSVIPQLIYNGSWQQHQRASSCWQKPLPGPSKFTAWCPECLYHYFDNSNTVLPMATTSPVDPSIHNSTFHPSSLNCDLNTWHLMESRVAVRSTHRMIQPPCLLDISISMILCLLIVVVMAMLLVALLHKNIQMTGRGFGMNSSFQPRQLPAPLRLMIHYSNIVFQP